jgi:glycosyltransferase involved in cell wall biosynthesis
VNKFAHVTGGADQHCLLLARALRERGHEVAFLSTASPFNVESEGCFVPCTVDHASRDQLSAGRQVAVAAAAVWNRAAGQAMDTLWADFRPHIVHAHKLYPQLSAAPLVVAARHGVPVVQTLHDYELLSASALDDKGGVLDRDEAKASYRALNALLHQTRRRFHVPNVTQWTACSSFVAQRYATRGIKAVPIANFVESAPTAPDHSFAARDGIVFCAKLAEEKGVNDILELARRLPNHSVKVAGGGDLAPVVADAARSVPNLAYLGRISADRVPGLLRSARVVAIPSRWAEPGALITLEALAVGTPVVVYRSGGLTEYVADTGGGRVISPDLSELVTACKSLHDDEKSWMQHSRAGASSVRTRYTPSAFVQKLEPVYAAALSGSLAA